MKSARFAWSATEIRETDQEGTRGRTSYLSEHGIVLFPDPAATTTSTPWCLPETGGFGVIAYNINLAITHTGTFSLVLSDLSPATRFARVSIDVPCAGNDTGKSFVREGYGAQWSMPVVPGDFCLTNAKVENDVDDVWFTPTATRP